MPPSVMGLPGIVEYARNFAVMVRIEGPDPKGLKMRNHAFHQYHSGRTTLSASGFLLPDTLYDVEVAKRLSGHNDACPALVMTVASLVEPFLSLQHRQTLAQGRPELVPGVHIDILIEGKVVSKESKNLNDGAPCWVAAQVLTLADIPTSALALQTLTETSLGTSENGWEVGWSLASHSNSPQPFMNAIQTQRDAKYFLESQSRLTMGESGNSGLLGKSTTRIVILGVSLSPKDVPNILVSRSIKRGDFLLAVGSPFGVLSPTHFFNSISVGSVANCYPASSLKRSLLMADIRGLPGMEGGPVFGEYGHLLGILIKPIRQKASFAEVQLVIPWEAIAAASSDLLQKEPQNADKGTHYKKEILNAGVDAFTTNEREVDGSFSYIHKPLDSYYTSQLPVEKAMAAICLVTVDDGVWASGVLLNDQGLILTNAHLLEPWRFGKTTVSNVRYGTKSEDLSFLSEESGSLGQNKANGNQKSQSLLPESLKKMHHFVDERGQFKTALSYGAHQKIRVRLDHLEPWVWCDAKVVYICRGPLDVALLQLEYVPDELSPIEMDFECPSLGSQAYVIGHGLFGPRCGFSPSVSSGVVTKVVKAKIPPSYPSDTEGNSQGHFPVMLETTAAVHPGGSGGAVVNSDGHMIGLVTSNARHGGGTVIPHLNFSVPCAALAPIVKFSKDMQDLSLLRILDQPNENFSSVWALMPQLSPKPPPLPVLPQSLLEDNKEGKGSRFAKFMAESQKLLKKPIQSGKVERLSDKIISSKL